MKNIMITLLTLAILTSSLIGMERAPQPQLNFASLQGLPKDLKTFLEPYAASGTIKRGIQIAAMMDKSFKESLNDPQIMLSILNWTLTNTRPRSRAIEILEKLQQKTAALPVMQNSQIVELIARARREENIKPLLADFNFVYGDYPRYEIMPRRHVVLPTLQNLQDTGEMGEEELSLEEYLKGPRH